MCAERGEGENSHQNCRARFCFLDLHCRLDSPRHRGWRLSSERQMNLLFGKCSEIVWCWVAWNLEAWTSDSLDALKRFFPPKQPPRWFSLLKQFILLKQWWIAAIISLGTKMFSLDLRGRFAFLLKASSKLRAADVGSHQSCENLLSDSNPISKMLSVNSESSLCFTYHFKAYLIKRHEDVEISIKMLSCN